MDKKIFLSAISVLQEQYELNNKITDSFTVVFSESHERPFYSGGQKLFDWMVSYLAKEMGDETDKWIEYFIYELDFGRNWLKGRITLKNGKDFRCDSAEQLYKLLTNKKSL